MLVRDCMTRHPIMIAATTKATEAQRIMAENRIRHLPVVGPGKRLEGLVTRATLLVRPDLLSSLSVWDISRYVGDLSVDKVMLTAANLYTIEPDRTVEEAAHIMTEQKISCLPVVEDGVVVGILSEVDLLHSYQQMLGLPAEGVRATVRMPDREGEFAKLSAAIASNGLGIMGIGSFPSPRLPGYYDVVLKIPKCSVDEVKAILNQVPDQELIDIRTSG